MITQVWLKLFNAHQITLKKQVKVINCKLARLIILVKIVIIITTIIILFLV